MTSIIDVLRTVKLPDDFQFMESRDFKIAKQQESLIAQAIQDTFNENDISFTVCSIDNWLSMNNMEWSSALDSCYGDIVIHDIDNTRILSIDLKTPFLKNTFNSNYVRYGSISILSLVNMINTSKTTNVPALYMMVGSNRSIKLVDVNELFNHLTNSDFGIDSYIRLHKPQWQRQRSICHHEQDINDLNGKIWFYNEDDRTRILSNIDDPVYYIHESDYVSNDTIMNM